MENNKAQIWIEVVIYTLIGLTILGIAVGIAKPKIDALSDKVVIQQSIDSLNIIDGKINEVQQSPGNKRKIELKISKGKLAINPEQDRLSWEIESRYQYSESGKEIPIIGTGLKILTEGESSPWKITIISQYANTDLTYNQENAIKEFSQAPNPYVIFIENIETADKKHIIDISEQ